MTVTVFFGFKTEEVFYVWEAQGNSDLRLENIIIICEELKK